VDDLLTPNNLGNFPQGLVFLQSGSLSLERTFLVKNTPWRVNVVTERMMSPVVVTMYLFSQVICSEEGVRTRVDK